MGELQTLQQKINYDKTFDCVQCGYCLPACPTYETMEKETHSPRGRINLVKMVAEGKASVEDLEKPMEKCLGCMACTTVCPTNVQYGQILEGAKEVIEDHRVKSASRNRIEDFLFGSFFPSEKWMNTLGNLTWFYQRTGIQALANISRLTKLAPLHLDKFEKVIPKQPSPKERAQRMKRYIRKRPAQAKVAFFTGCVMDGVFFQTNQNTLELLLRFGFEVVIPEQQTCCGALHAHSGKVNDSIDLAKRNIVAFEEEEVDYIVNNAGGCGARMVEYHHLFKEGTSWHKRAKQFVSKIRDISEVLVEADGVFFNKSVDKTVTYQPSCHMTNVQKVKTPPLQLMKKVPGVKLKELARPDFCCGSAGIYNIVNYEDSMDILDLKMNDVCGTGSESVVTTNPGCLLQMKLGIEREGVSHTMNAVHLVDLLLGADPQQQ
ncbi:(Fe-S)-binding protein [Halobacillus karajensis]|uniref:Glycolate oxidase iron-sulfur subunit n=1 Tax=Halobacillus karajensis TaxID=195088 RepID=A0A024P5Y0_9BACI|nr:(Fe-S)-binding protein [Halobacillus karajensis]CDQ20788.1 Lactate utilization protein A [Halobacillus karajensis]CDQ23742.1 Lactate utilization protein A [Halobacillus karajensis]CDQ27220.1 Lactate utilization protein A [Halobacillus karajensis]